MHRAYYNNLSRIFPCFLSSTSILPESASSCFDGQGTKIQDIEVKRELVKEVTEDALEKVYKLPREIYVVLIKENSPENVGGKLILDKMKK
jgi:phenylpyruvate tautomerase PptA (4-oxalocrotonate tautomerase family)